MGKSTEYECNESKVESGGEDVFQCFERVDRMSGERLVKRMCKKADGGRRGGGR